MLLIALLALFAFASCGDDDDDDKDDSFIPAQPANPEDDDAEYIGAWMLDWEDGDLTFFVFDESGKFTLYDTTEKLYENGYYESKEVGTYTYNASSATLRINNDGEFGYARVVTKKGETYLEIDDEYDTFYAVRINRSSLPTKEYGD